MEKQKRIHRLRPVGTLDHAPFGQLSYHLMTTIVPHLFADSAKKNRAAPPFWMKRPPGIAKALPHLHFFLGSSFFGSSPGA